MKAERTILNPPFRNGLYSPLGIETPIEYIDSMEAFLSGMASTARWGLKHFINGAIPPERASGMASTARWGLKHTSQHLCQARSPLRNGLYSPLGIETEDILYKAIPIAISGMASTARWGLKPRYP